MVADDNKVYALIQGNEISWIFTKIELPEWNENDIKTIDITDIAPRPEIGWVYEDGIFIAPFVEEVIYDLEANRTAKSLKINKDCENHILAGFPSDALGVIYTYPNNDRDQVNLSGSILRSTLPSALETDYYPFLCMSSEGVWSYQLHTATQIQKVGSDAYNYILEARVKNATLQYQVFVANSKEDLDLITW